jgi:hypothetical protein
MKSQRLLMVPLWLSLGACVARQPPESPRPAAAPDSDAGAVLPDAAQTAASPAAPVPVSCRPERAQAITVAAGRLRRCVIDVGSRNVKLLVASLQEDDPRSLTGDRICRSRMQLGEKVFDQKAQAARPLGQGEVEALVQRLSDYAALCKQDGGELVGAVATEWARRATNLDQIRQALQAAGLTMQVLSREDEARYGYLAATRGAPGKIVLDFGSRSLQLSYWPRGAAAPLTASLPLGIDEAGDRFFGNPDFKKYAQARAAFIAAVRTGLAPQIVSIKRGLRASTLAPQLFSLAENGDVPLGLAGKLWQADARSGVDEATYATLVKAHPVKTTSEYGPVTAELPPKEFTAFAKLMEANPALFNELRSDRLKRIYGYKMLAVPALVSALAEDLRLDEVVLVPQEMPEGLVIDRLRQAK